MKKTNLPFTIHALFAYVLVGSPILGYVPVWRPVGMTYVPKNLIEHPETRNETCRKQLITTGKGRNYNSRSTHRQHNHSHLLRNQTTRKQHRQTTRMRA